MISRHASLGVDLYIDVVDRQIIFRICALRRQQAETFEIAEKCLAEEVLLRKHVSYDKVARSIEVQC